MTTRENKELPDYVISILKCNHSGFSIFLPFCVLLTKTRVRAWCKQKSSLRWCPLIKIHYESKTNILTFSQSIYLTALANAKKHVANAWYEYRKIHIGQPNFWLHVWEQNILMVYINLCLLKQRRKHYQGQL